jgi:hypothetical protein
MGAWNYPINLLLMPVVGAIAAGNCIVINAKVLPFYKYTCESFLTLSV